MLFLILVLLFISGIILSTWNILQNQELGFTVFTLLLTMYLGFRLLGIKK